MSSKAWVEKAGLLPKGIIGAMSLRDTKRTLLFHVIGEIKLKRGNSYLIIFLAAVLLSLFFIIFDKDGSSVRNDATIYLGLAKNVLEGHGYSDQAIVPYAPTMKSDRPSPFTSPTPATIMPKRSPAASPSFPYNIAPVAPE